MVFFGCNGCCVRVENNEIWAKCGAKFFFVMGGAEKAAAPFFGQIKRGREMRGEQE